MKLKDLLEQYGEYEVSETKGDWCDAGHITLELEKPKPKTVWELKKGDDAYYYIDGEDAVLSTWYDWECDRNRLNIGNAFLTKEDAEKDIERKKVEALLLKYGGRRWFKKSGENWILFLDTHNQATRFETAVPYQGFIYFDSHEEAVNACEQIGNKRIVDALFEVR